MPTATFKYKINPFEPYTMKTVMDKNVVYDRMIHRIAKELVDEVTLNTVLDYIKSPSFPVKNFKSLESVDKILDFIISNQMEVINDIRNCQKNSELKFVPPSFIRAADELTRIFREFHAHLKNAAIENLKSSDLKNLKIIEIVGRAVYNEEYDTKLEDFPQKEKFIFNCGVSYLVSRQLNCHPLAVPIGYNMPTAITRMEEAYPFRNYPPLNSYLDPILSSSKNKAKEIVKSSNLVPEKVQTVETVQQPPQVVVPTPIPIQESFVNVKVENNDDDCQVIEEITVCEQRAKVKQERTDGSVNENDRQNVSNNSNIGNIKQEMINNNEHESSNNNQLESSSSNVQEKILVNFEVVRTPIKKESSPNKNNNTLETINNQFVTPVSNVQEHEVVNSDGKSPKKKDSASKRSIKRKILDAEQGEQSCSRTGGMKVRKTNDSKTNNSNPESNNLNNNNIENENDINNIDVCDSSDKSFNSTIQSINSTINTSNNCSVHKFQLKWIIDKFSLLMRISDISKTHMKLKSEVFYPSPEKKNGWFMELDFNNISNKMNKSWNKNQRNNEYFLIHLTPYNYHQSKLKLLCEFSILNNSNRKRRMVKQHLRVSSDDVEFTTFKLCKKTDISSKINEFLPNDQLTLITDIIDLTSTDDIIPYETIDKEPSGYLILKNAKYIYENNDFCDAIIVTSDGKEFPVLKFILKSYSTKFDELFNTEVIDNKYHVDDHSDSMKLLLDYIYTDQLPPDIDDYNQSTINLFDLGKKYLIKDLNKYFEKNMFDTLTVESAIKMLPLVESNSLPMSTDKVYEFINQHRQEVFHSPEFINLEKNHPHLAVKLYRTTFLSPKEEKH